MLNLIHNNPVLLSNEIMEEIIINYKLFPGNNFTDTLQWRIN